MTYEFVGLPGVGKSSVARALEAHGFTRVRITSRFELLWRNVAFAVTHPYAWGSLLVAVIRSARRHGRFYPLFMNVFLDTNARVHKAGRYPKAIIDQGYLQGLLSLTYHELTATEISRFLSKLPQADVVCLLQTDNSTREQRLIDRGYRPRAGESTECAWYDTLESNIRGLQTYLQSSTASKFEIYDTTDTIEIVTQQFLTRHKG